MQLGGASRDSTGFGAMEEGLISSGGRKFMFPLLTSPGPDLHFTMKLGKLVSVASQLVS